MEFNPYIALAFNGFFTGLGVVSANHIYELYFRKRINKINKKLQKFKKNQQLKL